MTSCPTPVHAGASFGPSVAAGSIGAGRPDDATAFPALAALVKGRLTGPLDVLTRHDRPVRRRQRKGPARRAEKADLRRARRRPALRARAGDGLLARGSDPGHSPFLRGLVV